MRIARVHIEHFRSIKETTFIPSSYCVLVGENNTGKSNVLRAINLVLGEAWPSERSFSEEDFFSQDTSKDIVIQVYFDKEIQDQPNGYQVGIAGFELRCKAYKKLVGKKPAGTLKVDYVCINSNGKGIVYPATRLKKGEKYEGQWLPLRVSNDRREEIPFIYVGVLREYDRQNPGNRWSILRKIFNEVNTDFLNDKTRVDVTLADGAMQKLTRKDAFERTVKDAYKYLRTDMFVDIEKRLAANAMDQMGLDPGEGKITLHFESHDPTHVFKSLQLYVDQMGITSPAGEVGAGLQSAIVVGIFRTYEELKKEGAVFAVEEPEVFLHPQKARYFEAVLRRLSENGNQVFLTTHSPIFVRIDQPETVAKVHRTKDRGTWISQATKVEIAENDRKALRLMTEFDAQRNELFFASKVMLVEGITEKIALSLVFRALGIDINQSGISIVECGGKTKLPLFVLVVKALGIPYIVLADEDTHKDRPEKENNKHKQWNEALQNVADADRLFFLKPDFESEVGLPHDESEKVSQALIRFQSMKAAEVPDCLKNPINRLLEIDKR